MEVKLYAVSVQWGKGMHHFVATDLTKEQDAIELARAVYRQKARMNSSIKHIVHIWKHDSQIQLDEEG